VVPLDEAPGLPRPSPCADPRYPADVNADRASA